MSLNTPHSRIAVLPTLQCSRIPILSILSSMPAPGEDVAYLVSQELAAQRADEDDKDLEVSFTLETEPDSEGIPRLTGYVLLNRHTPEREQSYIQERWEEYAEDDLAELQFFSPPERHYRNIQMGTVVVSMSIK